MKIFISWSGQLSKELGEVFRDWIPGVLQFVRPYFTPDDIEKGSRWSSEIAKELQESQIGVIMLTRENLLEPWIMFEAGALSKQLEKSKICPILFGLENTDLVGPLVQFQATSFTKVDMKKLVKTINNECGDSRLVDNVLDSVVEMWWPRLEEQVNSVLGKERVKAHTKIRSERELIEEILGLTRIGLRSGRETLEDLGFARGAIEDLTGTYSRLKQAVELNDITMMKELCVKIGDPIEYLYSRYDVDGRHRERVRAMGTTRALRERMAADRVKSIEQMGQEKEQEMS